MGQKSFETLKRYFDRKQEKNPQISLRAFAQRLGISPAYLSKILAGKKPLPLEKVQSFAKALEIDAYGIRQLQRALISEQSDDADIKDNLELDLRKSARLPALPSESLDKVSPKKYSILEEWHYLPILDLISCRGFSADPKWIADRLGLKETVAEQAWKRLINLGCIQEENGRWRKWEQNVLFPNSRLDPLVQRHHVDMMKRAIHELQTKKEPAEFDRRIALSATVSSNEKSVRKAKKYLEEAFVAAAEILAEGEADRVYSLALQAFPLTNEK